MKKYLLMLPMFLIGSFAYADWLPDFPMDIYGNTNVVSWTIEVYANWNKIATTSIKNWIYWSTNATVDHVLLNKFDWILSFKIIYNGTTYDTIVQSDDCPAKTFVSKACRYDLDIVKNETTNKATGTSGVGRPVITKDSFKPVFKQVSKAEDEMQQAYKFAYENKITTQNTYYKANMNWTLTRAAMAKMLSYFAINILEKKPDISRTISFPDVSWELDYMYNNWITLAYQLWIMWINVENFRPNDLVTRAEFCTALSRLLYWTPDGSPYYKPHLEKLKTEWIITDDDPDMLEIRWYVMIMLMRYFNK